MQTYGVYISTDSNSAPVAIAGTHSAAVAMVQELNKVLPGIAYVDGILSLGEIPQVGYYRDADSMTMVREVAV